MSRSLILGLQLSMATTDRSSITGKYPPIVLAKCRLVPGRVTAFQALDGISLAIELAAAPY
jgi:hypothetical protein